MLEVIPFEIKNHNNSQTYLMDALQRKKSELLKKSKGDNGNNGFIKMIVREMPEQLPGSTGNQQDNTFENSLELVETNSVNSNKNEHLHELIAYRIQGCNLTNYVSDLYLQQRISNAIDEGKKYSEQNIFDESKQEDFKKSRTARYFETHEEQNEIRFAKCYRCGKMGHSIKHCSQQQEPVSCMYCLGNHHHNSCNTRSCFQCNEMGHIAKECRVSKLKCKKCGNRGHSEHNCGVIIFLNYEKMRMDRIFREKYGYDDLINLRCLVNCSFPMGHFNCHLYENNKEICYSQAKTQKTIERQRFILSNFNKLREKYYKQQVIKSSVPQCNSKGRDIESFRQIMTRTTLEKEMEVQ